MVSSGLVLWSFQVYTKKINYQRVAREDLDLECFFMTRSQVRRAMQQSTLLLAWSLLPLSALD